MRLRTNPIRIWLHKRDREVFLPPFRFSPWFLDDPRAPVESGFGLIQERSIRATSATEALHGLDAHVQRCQIQCLHERPRDTRRVIMSRQRFQIDRAKLALAALRRHDARRRVGPCRLGAGYTRRQLSFTEQARRDLFTLASTRRSAHGLLKESAARFVHTF